MSEREIKLNAELVIEQLGPLSDVDFGYNSASIQWLEDYIERLRQLGTFQNAENERKLMSMFGSFLGECIIHCYGGAWVLENNDWCISFDSNNAVSPFAKVSKQMNIGLDEGIGGFFRMIPVLYAARSEPSK